MNKLCDPTTKRKKKRLGRIELCTNCNNTSKQSISTIICTVRGKFNERNEDFHEITKARLAFVRFFLQMKMKISRMRERGGGRDRDIDCFFVYTIQSNDSFFVLYEQSVCQTWIRSTYSAYYFYCCCCNSHFISDSSYLIVWSIWNVRKTV